MECAPGVHIYTYTYVCVHLSTPYPPTSLPLLAVVRHRKSYRLPGKAVIFIHPISPVVELESYLTDVRDHISQSGHPRVINADKS